MKLGKIIGGILGVIVLLVGGLFIFLMTLDVNKYKPLISEEAKKATGRALAIGGNLSLKLSLSPSILIEDVSFANMPTGSRPEMAKIKRLEAQVSLLPLLSGAVQVNRLVVIEPDILIETDRSGKSNLAMGPSDAPAAKDSAPASNGSSAPPNIAIEEVRIERAHFTQRDGKTGAAQKIGIDKLVLKAKNMSSPLAIELAGDVDGKAFELAGTTGPVSDFLAKKPWPLDLAAKAAFALPVPVKISGTLAQGENSYAVDGLKLALGKSLLNGSAKVALAGKPKATLRLASDLVDLAEIAPASEKKDEAAKKSADGRVFPADPLPLDGLKAVDADAEVKIAKLVLPNKVALDGVDARLVLNNGRLETKPFALKLGGGDIAANLLLDANSGNLNLAVTGKDVVAGNIARDMGNSDMFTGGPTDIQVDLKGNGGSVRALMAGLGGDIKIVMGKGRVNNTLINWGGGDIMTQLMSSLNPMSKKEDYTPISCGVVRFKVTDGMATAAKGIAVETDRLDIVGDGRANLKTEGLDFGIKPNVKEGLGVGMGNLAGMVRLSGTMANPTVGVDAAEAAKTALKAGAAVASGGLSVLGGALLDKTGVTSPSGAPCLVALGTAPQQKQETAKPAPSSSAPKTQTNPVDSAKGALKGLFGR